MVPIGTFSEPSECFHASNRMISSFSVIAFVMRGAGSPSRIGVSSAPMCWYTIRTL